MQNIQEIKKLNQILDKKNISSAHILTLATDYVTTILFITSAPSTTIELFFLMDKHSEDCFEYQMARKKEIQARIGMNIFELMMKHRENTKEKIKHH